MTKVSFTFDGHPLIGFAGEPLAAALLRAGRHVFAESPYRHRPRGVMTPGADEPNALMQVDSGSGEPLRPASQIEVTAGLVVRSSAGVGELPNRPDIARYDKAHRHTDLLVIGAGLAGLHAAADAARAGQRVILLDEQPSPGGALLARRDQLDPALLKSLAVPNLLHLQRTTATGLYDGGYAIAVERRTDHLPHPPPHMARIRIWHIRAANVILATGAQQRPLIFPDNDRPGIMLADAAAGYAQAHGIRWPAAVIATTDDSGHESALRLLACGIPIATVADIRHNLSGPLIDKLRAAKIPLLEGHAPVGTDADAYGVLTAVHLAPASLDGRVLGPASTYNCTLLAVSGGWSPTLHLASHAGTRAVWDATRAAFVPDAHPHWAQSIGAAAGDFPPPANPPAIWFGILPDGEPAERCFLDLQRDATLRDLRRAIGAGLTSPEHVKRYTTIGTANDQGKTSGVLTIGVLAQLTGKSPGDIGTTTYRPPYIPIPFAALAGRERGALSDPARVTAIHNQHVAAGADFENVGQWKRPWYFAQPGESMHSAVLRECRAARESVAFMDASTLGKIDIQGPDAPIFLDRIYTNMFSTLKVGHGRYGLMLGLDGMILDDGVTMRLAVDRYFMTTTTGGAARVLDWLEEWLQTEWPDLRVYCTSVTEQWATVAIVGPHSRTVLAALAPDLNVSTEAFPFLTFRECRVAGIPARICRISFSGELAYEINVASWYAADLWGAVMRAGAPHAITPYGTETLHVLRAEKGYFIVGQETDGTQSPIDLGLSGLLSTKKDFVGRRSLARSDAHRPDRKQLVGLLPADPKLVIPEGAALIAPDASRIPPVPMLGHVTSAYESVALNSCFALALVANGRARIGQTLLVPLPDGDIPVQVVDPILYDKENRRRDGSVVSGVSVSSGPVGSNGPRGQVSGTSAQSPLTPETRHFPHHLLRSPLAGATHGHADRVLLAELPFMVATDFRAPINGPAAKAVAVALGLSLPDTVGLTAHRNPYTALTLGPDWWLILGDGAEPHLRTAIGNDFASIVDVSAQRTCIEISGPHARHVLEHGWEQDLDPNIFPVGRCSQGLIARAPLILHHAAPHLYHLHVRASFAPHLWHFLTDAALEYLS